MSACSPAIGEPRAVLVVLPTWVGDFVMATPTLRAIRCRFADARVTYLMEPNLRDLVAGGDWMDECIEWPAPETQKRRNGQMHPSTPRTWWALRRTLRARKFDLAILLPNSFRAALIAWLSGATRRVGYARDGRSMLLTDPLPVRNRRGKSLSGARGSRAFLPSIRVGTKLPVRLGRYTPMPLVEYFADLAEAIGCERPDDQLELFATADCDASVEQRLATMADVNRQSTFGPRPIVVISPGARFGASKCWMPDRYAAVADRLVQAADATVIITCGPQEEEIARAIGAAMKQPGFVSDSPRLTLGELKSLIRRADLLVGNDAGPRHIAKAFGVPVVTIFGPTHPDWTATNYPKERIVRIDVDCGPCQQRICPLGHHQCMTGVTVEAVVEAAHELLQTRTRQNVAAR